jgi:signal transduction histidine kinase
VAQELHILVVDDEPGMRSGVARALRDLAVPAPDGEPIALHVQTAGSGEEALAAIAQRRPDIMLLDHRLPGIDGLAVLDQAAHEDMLTVMMTAYPSLETAVSATKRGAHDFLAKPFTPDELRSTIRKAAAALMLARQTRRLEQERRQVRFQFISVLAHELKAPLGAVETYLRIIKERSAGDDPKTYEHMLDRSIIRCEGMRKLIADLLDLTRIESGTRKREIVDLDLRDVARSAIETAAPEAARRGIGLALTAASPAPIRADRSEMEIILNNLISNAVKYNRDGGKVDVRLVPSGGGVVVDVSDTGIGMTAEECGRLFGDFVRIKNDKTRNIMGSGLGLSIVQKLVHLYGGEIEVASQPEAGSTFKATLRNAPPVRGG